MMNVRVRPMLAAIPDNQDGDLSPDMINLATNEMRMPPPPEVVDALRRAAATANQYPQRGSSDLTARLAKHHHRIDPLKIVVGNGSANVLLQLMIAVCDTDSSARPEVVYASPGFEAYATLPRIPGAKVVEVPLADHYQDLDALHALIDRDRTRMVVLCNPHNPTGTALNGDDVEDFLERVPGNVLVVLDEAYRDFVTDPDVADGTALFARGEWENLVVVRSMSKGFALGGARIGYALAEPHIAAAARKCGVPFSVNSFAQAAGVAALDHADAYIGMRELIRRERQWVRHELLANGYTVPESHTNFLWLPLGEHSMRFRTHCLAHNVVVKAYAPPGRGVRVTIGTPEENCTFVAAARTFHLDDMGRHAVPDTGLAGGFIVRRDKQFIGGEWRAGSKDKVLVDHNPYDGSVIGEFTIADVTDIDAAYQAAATAQAEWTSVNAYQKRGVFERAIRYVEDHADAIGSLLARETGSTTFKAEFEIGLVIDMLKEAATFPLRMEGRILPSPVDDKENLVYREPVGVVGVISPFNAPFFLSMKSVAPALAAGNGVVLKPHEETPITGGVLLGEIFEAAGLPPGLLNVVITEIPAIGDAFVEHPIPQVISFTGSAAVGQRVAQVAVRNFKKPILEMGGNSALIVLEDADLDLAVDAAAFSRFTHSGQICMSANRILVHKDLHDAFLARFIDKVRSLPVGDPTDPGTIIGPLINQAQVDAVYTLIQTAITEGAVAAYRGFVNGTLLAPTVLTHVAPEMTVAQEEMFGPVVCVIPFAHEDEAVEWANNSHYGLSGAIHTGNIDRGIQLAKRIKTGMVHINDTTIADEPIIPFGGEKHSGIGRLNGEASLHEFTTLKWISVHRGRRQFPY